MIANRNIVIKREGNKLLLPTRERKEVASTHIPQKDYFVCRTISYNEANGILQVKLQNDRVDDKAFQISIEVNSNDFLTVNITRLHFIEANPRLLVEPNTQSSLTGTHLKNGTPIPKDFDELERALSKNSSEGIYPYLESVQTRPVEIIEIETILPFKDLDFHNGKVSFVYRISKIQQNITFEIPNPFIKKQHDSVKNIFATIFDTPRCALFLRVEVLHGLVVNQSATSPHISQIDDSVFQKIEDLARTERAPLESVRNSPDLSPETDEEIQPELLQDGKAILETLLSTNTTKHYNHLRFLSSKHLKEQNLRYTEKPYSFIFLIPNGSAYCVIWETYNTKEATYVWRLKSESESALEQDVEAIIEQIKWLRQNNKKQFIPKMPANAYRIQHDYSGDDMGFAKWRANLYNILEKGAI